MNPISRRTIERDIDWGTKFLGTLSRNQNVRRILVHQAGYSPEEHRLGWDLHGTLLGRDLELPETPEIEVPQQQAIADLDAWDGPAFERTRKTLHYLYPSQEAYLFRNLVSGRGAEAVGTVRIFLDRFVALRDGTDPERGAARTKDREAADVIVARRIVTPEKERELRQLIDIAERLAPEAAPPAAGPDEAYLAAAHQFHAWIIGWRAHARALVTRGDYLIQLGITTRTDPDDSDPGDEPPAPDVTESPNPP